MLSSETDSSEYVVWQQEKLQEKLKNDDNLYTIIGGNAASDTAH